MWTVPVDGCTCLRHKQCTPPRFSHHYACQMCPLCNSDKRTGLVENCTCPLRTSCSPSVRVNRCTFPSDILCTIPVRSGWCTDPCHTAGMRSRSPAPIANCTSLRRKPCRPWSSSVPTCRCSALASRQYKRSARLGSCAFPSRKDRRRPDPRGQQSGLLRMQRRCLHLFGRKDCCRYRRHRLHRQTRFPVRVACCKCPPHTPCRQVAQANHCTCQPRRQRMQMRSPGRPYC